MDDEIFILAESEGVFNADTFDELTGGIGDEGEEIILVRAAIPAPFDDETYSNSALVEYTRMSPCNSGRRTHKIDRITPHCVVGQCSVEALGELFQNYSRQTSSNYGIGADGRVALYVNESDRAWTSSSSLNDQRAVTVECASATQDPYTFYSVVYDKLIELCTDICRRNGKTRLLWIEDKDKALAYEPAENEMLLTIHHWFSPAKSCPGPWLRARLGEVAEKVTSNLNPAKVLYRVQIGAFSYKWRAESYAKKAEKKGFNTIIREEKVNGKTVYRVQCGAFSVKKNAENFKAALEKAGFPAVVVEVRK